MRRCDIEAEISRLEQELSKDTVTADSLKICVNGSVGKLGSKWSCLYSPALLIQVTVTGQLALLMLIEALESDGIPVVSANTDGIVIKCPAAKASLLESHIKLWEFWTGFETEETRYRALYSRDVNNYVAIKPNGDVKTKGAYAGTGLQKSPASEICTEAVVKFLSSRTPIEQTVRGCTDITKFVSIRSVTGGAQWNGEALGKSIRWYYATGQSGAIHYGKNGNKVPKTDGAKPLMQLPDAFPDDVDHGRYINEAHAMLKDLGVVPSLF